MTVSEYIMTAKMTKLHLSELELMSTGMVFDHFELYTQLMNPDKEVEVEATQSDIQKFKGR